MPRNYQRKTNRGNATPEMMETAARRVLDGKGSLRDVAKEFKVSFMTLQRYCKKLRETGKISSVGYATPRAVFTEKQEKLLVLYILNASRIHDGLTSNEIRRLAYEYASANEIKCPTAWFTNGIAGGDWFSKFMKRNRIISVRTPETTSSSSETDSNQSNVNKFLNNLKFWTSLRLMAYSNNDETSVTTVDDAENDDTLLDDSLEVNDSPDPQVDNKCDIQQLCQPDDDVELPVDDESINIEQDASSVKTEEDSEPGPSGISPPSNKPQETVRLFKKSPSRKKTKKRGGGRKKTSSPKMQRLLDEAELKRAKIRKTVEAYSCSNY